MSTSETLTIEKPVLSTITLSTVDLDQRPQDRFRVGMRAISPINMGEIYDGINRSIGSADDETMALLVAGRVRRRERRALTSNEENARKLVMAITDAERRKLAATRTEVAMNERDALRDSLLGKEESK